MRKLLLLATISFAAFSGVAMADEFDDITVAACSPMHRTTIIGVVGEPTTISFPNGQNIYRIVQTNKIAKDGELQAAGWSEPDPKEASKLPFDNVVPLWPTQPGTSTMTIITKTNDTSPQIVYPFRLIAIEPADAAKPGANVTFNLVCSGKAAPSAAVTTTPATAQTVRVAAKPKMISAEAKAAAEREIRTEAFNSYDGQCHYTAHGPLHSAITPRCPMSNGVWTLMRFTGLEHKPAVYVVTSENDERLARQHAAGEFVVVEEIDPHFRLRLGDSVLDIVADSTFDPAGKPTDSGTLVPGVQRELLQAKSR